MVSGGALPRTPQGAAAVGEVVAQRPWRILFSSFLHLRAAQKNPRQRKARIPPFILSSMRTLKNLRPLLASVWPSTTSKVGLDHDRTFLVLTKRTSEDGSSVVECLIAFMRP